MKKYITVFALTALTWIAFTLFVNAIALSAKNIDGYPIDTRFQNHMSNRTSHVNLYEKVYVHQSIENKKYMDEAFASYILQFNLNEMSNDDIEQIIKEAKAVVLDSETISYQVLWHSHQSGSQMQTHCTPVSMASFESLFLHASVTNQKQYMTLFAKALKAEYNNDLSLNEWITMIDEFKQGVLKTVLSSD